MDELVIKTVKLRENAVIPSRGSADAAGADLYACLEGDITIQPGETVFIPTGISVEIPRGYGGFVFARSGLASKVGLAPANKVGVIDADYRGEILVSLLNHSPKAAVVSPGERIAQLVIMPVASASYIEAASLSDTERGAGGFGSTGK